MRACVEFQIGLYKVIDEANILTGLFVLGV